MCFKCLANICTAPSAPGGRGRWTLRMVSCSSQQYILNSSGGFSGFSACINLSTLEVKALQLNPSMADMFGFHPIFSGRVRFFSTFRRDEVVDGGPWHDVIETGADLVNTGNCGPSLGFCLRGCGEADVDVFHDLLHGPLRLRQAIATFHAEVGLIDATPPSCRSGHQARTSNERRDRIHDDPGGKGLRRKAVSLSVCLAKGVCLEPRHTKPLLLTPGPACGPRPMQARNDVFVKHSSSYASDFFTSLCGITSVSDPANISVLHSEQLGQASRNQAHALGRGSCVLHKLM